MYACDNDVVDHQVVNIEYAGGVTASLTMTAFTPMAFRKTRIFGTRGMFEGDGYTVSVFDFLTGHDDRTAVVDPDDPLAGEGHLGADAALTRAFLAAVRDADPSRILTSPGSACTAMRRLGRRAGPAIGHPGEVDRPGLKRVGRGQHHH